MQILLEKYSNHPNLEKFNEILEKRRHLQLRNLKTSAGSCFFAAAYLKNPKPLLFIVNDSDTAGYFYNDLQTFLLQSPVYFLPATINRLTHNSGVRIDKSAVMMRTETLYKIRNTKNPIIVSFPDAIAETVVEPKTLNQKSIQLSVKQKISMDLLIEKLTELEYSKADFVFEPGQYAIRGSIVDVYSFSFEYPIRIDFFGNEIDSIRTFDIEKQLSIDKVDEVSVVANMQVKGNEKRTNFLNYINQDFIIVAEDSFFMLDVVERISEQFKQIETINPQTELPEIIEYTDFEEFKHSFWHFPVIHLNNHNLNSDVEVLDFNINAHPKIQKNFNLLADDLVLKQTKGYKTFVLSLSDKQLERLKDILQSSQVTTKATFTNLIGILNEGFTDNDLKIAVYTDHQIFERYHAYYLKNYNISKSKEAQLLNEIRELKIGDYVVHIDYGVGIFKGLTIMENDGKKQEVVRIDYAEGGVVFVNIHGLHKISKYKSSDAEVPKIAKLGTVTWSNLKNKAKKHVKDIAKDLIALYAHRLKEKGFAFSPDNYLQEAVEAEFIYDETPDQLKAINEIKEDMEKSVPMDRLVCGDVGFGKTEVAIRAAFKCALDGKQVAVLCPTTILAYQHYRTFTERLKEFPVSVEFISRLKSAKQQKDVLEKLQNGKIDIIIGTHRLVSSDVVFSDLGLLIIDEEQKFGVSVKEKLRHLRVNVDTLALTATPIPRTLEFSLMGARDLSILQTPPPNRQPIITELHVFSNEIIRKAIYYEVKRGGQVFFVHNHIETLPKIKHMLNEVLPDVSVEIAHGRLKPSETEDVITRFMQGEFDVLLTTSIVENGLDIPNANTIIINNAHHFGLSDLHQLRGRVGRSSKRAFCYLIAPPKSTLPDNSRRRLQAIENFVELGSGFNIALQDLDIRGAGDLLGAEQSGYINDIGYETFKRILEEAMLELRTTEYKHIFADTENPQTIDENLEFVNDCQINTDLNLSLTSDYISNEAERLRLYRQLDELNDFEQVLKFEKQLEDRFGKIPQQARDLIDVVRLRIMSKKLGIERIVLKNKTLICYFVSDKNSLFYDTDIFKVRILQYVVKNKECEFKEKNEKLYLRINHIETIGKALSVLKSI